jgi:hypothetical protein
MFRVLDGAKDCAVLTGIVKTAVKQGFSPHAAVRCVFNGGHCPLQASGNDSLTWISRKTAASQSLHACRNNAQTRA